VSFSSKFLIPTNFVASANAIGDVMVIERAPKTALKSLSESPCGIAVQQGKIRSLRHSMPTRMSTVGGLRMKCDKKIPTASLPCG
jgi:hypothetical protein